MKKKKYYARSGAPFKQEEAPIYKERLDMIASNNGGKFTPELVVDDAISKSSPFHTYFEWDDTKAGEQHRLQQARNLINHIVETVVIEGKPSLQRSFFNVKNGGGKNVYVTKAVAIKVKSYRTQLLNQIITSLENTTELMKLFKSQDK